MKELKELGFEYMPTRTEFDKARTKTYRHYSIMLRISSDYRNLIDQQPKLGAFIPCIDGVPVDEPEFGKSYPKSVIEQYEKALEQLKFEGWKLYHTKSKDDWCVTNGTCWFESLAHPTYEQAINDGVKLKIK